VDFGGGLVSGDLISAKIVCGKNSSLLITSQSSTKVYKALPGLTTAQVFDMTVEDGGLLLMIPHPVTCFAGARFQQKQSVHVDKGGSVVFIDWLTCGRCARGECWAFLEYSSKVHLRVAGTLVLNDCIRLSNEDGFEVSSQMKGYHTYANIFLIGHRVGSIATKILQTVQATPVNDFKSNKSVIFSANPINDGNGIYLRVAALNIEVAFAYIRDTLKDLFAEIGGDPYK